jgi:capsid protein
MLDDVKHADEVEINAKWRPIHVSLNNGTLGALPRVSEAAGIQVHTHHIAGTIRLLQHSQHIAGAAPDLKDAADLWELLGDALQRRINHTVPSREPKMTVFYCE